jgi:hypothetical protein
MFLSIYPSRSTGVHLGDVITWLKIVYITFV